jgi:hypothetical protein
MLFSHMNGVNQWINRFCISNDGIQNDINTIRVGFIDFMTEKVNLSVLFQIGSS